jgi:Tfp pilus assembly protein PilN
MPGITDELETMIRDKSLAVNQMFKFAGDLQGVEMNGLSSSVGACFAGLGIGTYKFNLLPHKGDYEIKKIAPLATKVFLVLVVLLTLGVFAVDAIKQKKALQVMETTLKKNEPVINEIKKMSDDINTLRKHSDLLHSIKSNEITLEVLAELANVLPKDSWVTNLTFKGFEIKSKKKDGGELTINGYAASSSILIPLLEDSPLFEKVEFVGPIKKTKNKEQFKLSAKIIRPAVSGGKSK